MTIGRPSRGVSQIAHLVDIQTQTPLVAYGWLQNRDIFGFGVTSFYDTQFNAPYKKHAAQGLCTRLKPVRAIKPKVSNFPDLFS
jgi:hypothetical protein